MTNRLKGQLTSYYTRVLTGYCGPVITDLSAVEMGWENEVYTFNLDHGIEDRRRRDAFVLRIYPGDDAYAKSAQEFNGMRRLLDEGYPVPEVFVLERDRSPFDSRPFVVMERVEGQTVEDLLCEASEGQQAELWTRFCGLFVRLHNLDWRPFAEERSQGPFTHVDRGLAFVEAYLERYPNPGFAWVFDWMRERRDRVPCHRPSPIHWDFHTGNILMDEAGHASVIDWTQFEVSDPRFDLAWTLVLEDSHAEDDLRSSLLKEYENISGSVVESLEWFEVYACLKRLGSVFLSVAYGPQVVGMRPEATPLMIEGIPSLVKVYSMLRDRTSLQIPEVEEMFSRHG